MMISTLVLQLMIWASGWLSISGKRSDALILNFIKSFTSLGLINFLSICLRSFRSTISNSLDFEKENTLSNSERWTHRLLVELRRKGRRNGRRKTVSTISKWGVKDVLRTMRRPGKKIKNTIVNILNASTSLLCASAVELFHDSTSPIIRKVKFISKSWTNKRIKEVES